MVETTPKKHKPFSPFWYLIPTVLLFFLLPILVRMLTVDAVGLNVYTALFGVLITAVITLILLRGQAEQQQDIEKNSLIYAEKIKVYKAFLAQLEAIVKADAPTRSDVLAIRCRFAALSIHLTKEQAEIVSESLACIFSEILGVQKSNDDSTQEEKVSLSKELLKIADVFSHELYPKEDKDNKKAKEDKKESHNLNTPDENNPFAKIIGHLDKLDDQLEQPGIAEEQSLGQQQSIATLLSATEKDFYSIFKNNDGWVEAPKPDNTSVEQYAKCISDIPNIGNVLIGFNAEGGAEGPFFQCHLKFEDDELRRACYLAMRREFGGRINKWCWWKPFPKEWAERIRTNPTDTELRKYITATIGRVYQWVLGYKKIMTLYNRYNSEILQNNEGWRPGIWANYVWNFFHSTSPLYLDIDYAEDSTELRIWITNNNHNTEELKEQLAEVLPGEKYNAPNNKEPYFHLYKEHLTEEAVVKELKALLPKLAACVK